MKTHKISLPKIDKPEFGNSEQINAIREYQRKVDSDMWKVSIVFSGGYYEEIQGENEEEVKEKAWENTLSCMIDAVEIDVNIAGKIVSEDEKEKINSNNLSLFKGEVI